MYIDLMKLIQLVTFILGLSIILSAFSDEAFAQEAPPVGHAISFHMGPLLPNSFPATDEILSGVGFRYGYPIFQNTLLEGGYT